MRSLVHLVRRPARTRHRASPQAEEFGRDDPVEARSAPASAPGPSGGPDGPSRPRRLRPTFTSLPPEIHLLIAQYLSYPDALSLKHTNRYFYQLVDTGVRLKVEWLMERRLLHLECPSNQRCDLGSDLRFCRGSVKLLMRRRREHIECESRPGLGCIIYGTSTCPHARKLKTRFKRWMRAHTGDPTRWLLLIASLVPLLYGWILVLGAMLV